MCSIGEMRIESFRSGTLYLNAVHVASEPLKASVCRFIESRSLSDTDGHSRSADIIRILASSDGRTDGALENGTFALESCARTRAEIVHIPPLRARTEDINPPSGNQTRAATLLGLNRDQVRYRIEKFGLPRN